MDGFLEFMNEFAGKLSAFKEILSAVALIIIDFCALAIVTFAAKEKRVVQAQWNKAARFMVLTDYDENFCFTLNSEEILLGRHMSVDLRFPDMSVSRYHALLSLSDGKWIITDLDSKSGTYVNGQRIQQVQLRNNDEIKIGKKLLYIKRKRA